MFSAPQVRLKVDLVVDKRCTEGAFFLRVVSLQFGNGLIVATLDGKLERFLPDVLELRIER